MHSRLLSAGLLAITINTALAVPLAPRITDPNPVITQDLLSSLELAPTVADRLTILDKADPAGSYFKYNFNLAANPSPGGGTGLGGSGVLANRKNFPALIGLGVAASVGFLNPCGMNTPHTHPRATEFLTIASGSNVTSGFIQESGETTPITFTLNQYEGGIFPMGSIHYEFNDSCEPAVFIAAFGAEDPGLSRIAQNFFGLAPDIVDSDLGYPSFLDHTNIAKFAPTIPAAFALGTKECLNRCGIKY
ncbi:Spherulin-1B [Hyphodiscus hymeniophilus]|uniref:Spherulin-1B n=1 Tax=Hyphodiscus hymeniophilus TaxID=353542 RepID=A0A9P7B0T0_9HELO|nr:Spherulin-1B [Hyphodiscus hymeniophilus]